MVLEGERTAPAQVSRAERAPTGTWLRIVMHEGRKHQIRDIGKLLGLPVQRLIRVRLGSLRLGNLQPGEWRHLKSDEVAQLRLPPAGERPLPTRRAAKAARQPPPAAARPAHAARRPSRRPAAPTANRSSVPNTNKTSELR